MTEAIIYMLFDRWCELERPCSVEEAIRKAVENPGMESLNDLVNIMEKTAFEAGAGACLNMIQCLLTKERGMPE